MTASYRSLALGFALGVGLVVGGPAVAASLPKGPMVKPTRKFPGKTVSPPKGLTGGLSARATLTPRVLHNNGASLNVHRAPQVETTANRVKMDKHTQLWVHFRADRNQEYDVECRFSGSKSILTMDYADGKFLRQQTTTPSSDGRLHHKIYARPKTENVKLYMQASGNLDWTRCTVTPAS
ncbi:MAG: hypothetical protein ACRBN8_40215 [Nannocystales bacterium]